MPVQASRARVRIDRRMPRVSRLSEIRPGLHHWTAPHPKWEPGGEPGSPADWPEEVGSVLYEAPGATVLFDPLVPEQLWAELDARVRKRTVPVHVLQTIRWHERDCAEAISRYDASTDVPSGVEAFPLEGLLETVFWIPEHGALVPGDRLIGDGAGGVRLCPQSWFTRTGKSVDDLREAVRPLLDLPVELVLLSHGEPVLERGAEALARV
jgi:hypothetical protein